MKSAPQTLVEAIRYFSDPKVCLDFVVSLRWPRGVKCTACESKNILFLEKRQLWKCRACKKQFSAKVGTIFEDSPIGLDKWLAAIWLIANAKNGISSYEIHRSIGVTQKTAWFMLHRIREAMSNGSIEKLRGHVEVDETFIGGKVTNMHKRKRAGFGTGHVGKAVVVGMLERGGRVKAKVIESTRRATLKREIAAHVEPGTNLYTDALASYAGLDLGMVHQFVDHAVCYAKGKVHTNGLENFWSLLKRTIRGTYVNIEPFHLTRYVDEQAFRFNERMDCDAGRFAKVAAAIIGKRLTYKELTGNA